MLSENISAAPYLGENCQIIASNRLGVFLAMSGVYHKNSHLVWSYFKVVDDVKDSGSGWIFAFFLFETIIPEVGKKFDCKFVHIRSGAQGRNSKPASSLQRKYQKSQKESISSGVKSTTRL